MTIDVHRIRQDFPPLQGDSSGSPPLVYLDNGATTLKPRSVIAAVGEYYSTYPANVHRGIHRLSQRATIRYEATRSLVGEWINASSPDEIVFTSGTTHSLNLVAHSYGELLDPGDEIILSIQEHHSNIVPWQLLEQRKGVVLKVVSVNDRGELELGHLLELLSKKTKVLAIPHVSNTLGTINPVKEITALVKEHSNAVVVIDGAQAMAHFKVDVADLGVDFYGFSAHKLFGPTGFGILFGKQQLLNRMPPFMGGGDMIETVTFEGTTFAPAPHRFEAGTPHIAGSIGLGAAIEYLQGVGMDNVVAHERELTSYGREQLLGVSGLRLLGDARERVGVFTFVMDGLHAQDVAMILDQRGIAVRTGHHCTWPLLQRFGVDSTVRASLGLYNTLEEIDQLVAALIVAKEVLS